MMTQFSIEFRLHGYPKHYLKRLIWEIAQKFRVKGAIKERPVPHVTLYGPSETNDIRKVLAVVEKVGRKYTLVPFAIKDFDWREGKKGKVIAASIVASPELKNLREELAKELSKISTHQPWDTKADFWFHTTVAFKDIDTKFDRIWHYVNAKEKVRFDQYLVRITILNKKGKIIREYDLLLKRWLKRWQAIGPVGRYWWRQTTRKLRELEGLPPHMKQPILDKFINFIKRFISSPSIVILLSL